MGDDKLCTCGHGERHHIFSAPQCGYCSLEECDGFTPARDDAEKPRLTAAEKRLLTEADGGACEPPCEMCLNLFSAVESILAAHMAAPDELTALRAERDREQKLRIRLTTLVGETQAERDALRERIRALADEWDGDWLAGETRDIVEELRNLIGGDNA